MTTIKLTPPKGYDTIKSLYDSTGRPVRSNPAPVPDTAPTRSCCRAPSGCCPVLSYDAEIDEHQEAHR